MMRPLGIIMIGSSALWLHFRPCSGHLTLVIISLHPNTPKDLIYEMVLVCLFRNKFWATFSSFTHYSLSAATPYLHSLFFLIYSVTFPWTYIYITLVSVQFMLNPNDSFPWVYSHIILVAGVQSLKKNTIKIQKSAHDLSLESVTWASAIYRLINQYGFATCIHIDPCSHFISLLFSYLYNLFMQALHHLTTACSSPSTPSTPLFFIFYLNAQVAYATV